MSKTPETVSQVPAIAEHVDDKMLKALQRAGVDPASVKVREVAVAVPTSLEELCDRPSSYPRATESPLLVVTKPIDVFPEAEQFKDYIGYVRVECVTDEGDHVAFTHYYARKDTGEMSPLTEWLLGAEPPYAFKVARIETRAGNRHVLRVIPV